MQQPDFSLLPPQKERISKNIGSFAGGFCSLVIALIFWGKCSPYAPLVQWYLLFSGILQCATASIAFHLPKTIYPKGAFTPGDALGMLMIPATIWGCIIVFDKGFDGFSAGEDVCPSTLFITAFFNAVIPLVIISVILVIMAGVAVGILPQSLADKVTGKEDGGLEVDMKDGDIA